MYICTVHVLACPVYMYICTVHVLACICTVHVHVQHTPVDGITSLYNLIKRSIAPSLRNENKRNDVQYSTTHSNNYNTCTRLYMYVIHVHVLDCTCTCYMYMY